MISSDWDTSLIFKFTQMIVDAILLCICGGIILYVYIYGLADPRITLGKSCLESDSRGFVQVMIIWGSGLVTVAFLNSALGFISNVARKFWWLYIYSTTTYVLALVEFLFFFTLYIHLGRVVSSMEVCLNEVMVRYYNGPYRSDVTTPSGAWDFLMREKLCCGIRGGHIFKSLVNWNRTWIERYDDPFFNKSSLKLKEFRAIALLPYTCCIFKDPKDREYLPFATVDELAFKMLDENCPFKPTVNNSYIADGCMAQQQTEIQTGNTIGFYVTSALEFLQMVAALCALYLSKLEYNRLKVLHRKQKRRMHWEHDEALVQHESGK